MKLKHGAALLLLGTFAMTGYAANAGPAPRWHGVADVRPAAGTAAPAVSASPAATDEDLRAALLGDADVPSGMTPVAMASTRTGKVSIGGGSFPGCPALEPMTTDETTSAAVTYAAGAVGPYLTHAIVRFPAGGAQDAMARLRSTTASCRSFEQQLAGITVRFTVAAADPPAGLGDDAAGLRMTGTTDIGISVGADIIAVRRHDYVIWLNDTAIGTSPAGLAASAAPAAAARCGQRLKDC
ncbi:hypothetical protein [Dactylosporangium salmoneum]|uniref:PknH-like extracellular domain-containing protein n=1 Tax=Dactylosporangium salmoneum TaxID=53361 RepID=A0ABP5STP6_9ACTN